MFSRISNLFIVSIMLIALVGVLQATAATEEEMLAVQQAMIEAFSAHDVEQFLSYLTEDVIHDYVPAPTPVTGKEENRVFMTDVFQAFPDAKGTNQRVLTSENILVSEWIFTGTLEGEWMGMGPTGKGGPIPHLTIFEFEGDKVKRMTTYFDMVTLMVNSGLMPAPELPPLEPSFTLPDPEPTGLAPLEADAELVSRFNSHDLSELAKMEHRDSEIRFNTLGMMPLNREEHAALSELFLLSDSTLSGDVVRRIDMEDGWIFTEIVYSGVHDGPYFGIPASGNPTVTRAAYIAHYDADGLLTNQNLYFDNLSVLTQIGAFPPLPPLPEYPPIPDYLVQDKITSPSLEGNPLGDAATRDVLVYLPPSYETSPDKRYPTIYLLHGYTGDHRLFVFAANVAIQSLTGIDIGVDIGDIVNSLMATGDLGEVIIVMPDAKNAYGGSWYERSELIGDYRNYIARDLVSYIDGKYRTIADREHRAIAGHSMGGYGALSLAMEYPGVFGAVTSLSPGASYAEAEPTIIDQFIAENPNTLGVPIIVSTDDDMWKLFLTKFWTNVLYSLAAAFSPNLDNPPYYVDLPIKYPEKTIVQDVWEKWLENDLVSQIERNGANLSNTPIFIDRGVGETVIMDEVAGIDRLPAALDAQGISYTYDEFDGDHLTHLRYQLESALKFLYPHIAPPVDTEANKALARRLFEEVWNEGRLDIADEIEAPNYVATIPGTPGIIGPEGQKQFTTLYLNAFPDVHYTIEDQIAEGDKVVTRWTATGTHQGELMGIPPTGVFATTVGITFQRITDGKIIEEWTQADLLGQMQQLGVIDPGGRRDYSWGEPSEVTGDPGDIEENKATAVRYTEEVWNQQNLDAADEIFIGELLINHEPVSRPIADILGIPPDVGLEGHKQGIAVYLAAFPDLHGVIDDMIVEGDKIVVRWTATGTHQGDFMGIPPTGKQLTWTGSTIYRFVDGKIAEMWWAWDALGLMQQLTAPPEKDYSNVFFMPLASGLNMISLPLEPITPYTARSFAEELFATVVIKLDEARQRFVGFTLDAPDDGFDIEGGKGYIVNVPKGGVFAFTGAAWTNEPPVEAAPSGRDIGPPLRSDGAWAFVVSGRFFEDSNDSLNRDGYLVTVKNTRTNAVATDVVRKGYFAAAFADLNRKNVVQMGDRLEVTVEPVLSETKGQSDRSSYFTVTAESIRQAFLPIKLKNVGIPKKSLLLQNYPNPFNPETWIPYQIRESSEVVIRIYNTQGQLVRTLDLGQRSAGFYLGHSRAAYWDGHNDAGEKVASGVYFYQLQAGDFSATRRMLVVK